MEDAYVIGIRLALDNGVAEGVAAVRGDLAALDRAIAASASQLETLRRAAASVLRPMPDAPLAAIADKPKGAAPRPVPPDTVPEPRSAEPGAVAAPVVVPRLDRMPEPFAVPVPVPVPVAPAPVADASPAPRRDEPRAPAAAVVAPAAMPAAPSAPVAPVKPMAPVARSAMPDPLPVEPTWPPPRAAAPVVSPAPVSASLSAGPPADFAAMGRALSPAPRAPDVVPAIPAATEQARPPLVSAAVAAPPRADASPPIQRLPAAPTVAAVQADDRPRRAEPVADRPMAFGPVVSPWPPASTGARASAPPAVPVQPAPAPAALRILTGGLAPALPSAVPPPDGEAPRSSGGDVFLDGVRVGRWMADRMERDAGRPPVGPTFFDPRQSPAWPGATVGM